MLDEFKQGPPGLIRRINELVRMCKQVWNMRGDGTVTVRRGENGIVVGLDINQLLPKIPKVSGGTQTDIRWAFCNGGASATAIQSCYIDIDHQGTPINVTCTICGGTALNSAFPRLEDTTRLAIVSDDSVSPAIWRALQIFQATEDC
jgi:hypothetical protein